MGTAPHSPSPSLPPSLLEFHSRNWSPVFVLPSPREDLDQEEKAKFGEYCSGEDGKGREWFARFVSAQVNAGKGGEGTRNLLRATVVKRMEGTSQHTEVKVSWGRI